MEIAQEKIDLISKIIKNDRKFSNNEDLFDDFLNETCKRSIAIIDTIDTQATLETYLRRIVTTSIINVLKDSGRLHRTREGYLPTQELKFAPSDSSSYENIEMVNDMIVDNIIFDNHIEDNIIPLIESLNIDELKEIVNKIDFKNKSIVILKK